MGVVTISSTRRIGGRALANNIWDTIRLKLTFLRDRDPIQKVIEARKEGQTGLLVLVTETENDFLSSYTTANPVTRAELERGELKDYEDFSSMGESLKTWRQVVDLGRSLTGRNRFKKPSDFVPKTPAP